MADNAVGSIIEELATTWQFFLSVTVTVIAPWENPFAVLVPVKSPEVDCELLQE